MPMYTPATINAFSGESRNAIATAGTALSKGPTVGMNSNSPARRPSAKAALTFRMSRAMVVTVPIAAMAMSCVTSHLRNTIAIRSITSAP